MPDSISKQYTIPASHPCFDGHFPGDPIVPGVIILALINALFQQWQPEEKLSAISQAKFHLPLRPDQPFIITLTRRNQSGVKFECIRDQDKLASGQFSFTKKT